MKNELTVTTFTPVDGINTNHRKENGFDRAYIAINTKGETIAELRLYWPGQTNCYACFWAWGNDWQSTGSGVAGGYGYDKRSAAASEAFTKAGIQLSQSVHGTGRQHEAMEAVGKHLSNEFLTVIEAYG